MQSIGRRRFFLLTSCVLTWLFSATQKVESTSTTFIRSSTSMETPPHVVDGDSSTIDCRLYQVESFLQSVNAAHDNNDNDDDDDSMDVSHSSFICRTDSAKVYSIEFQSETDSELLRSKYIRPAWITFPADWLQSTTTENVTNELVAVVPKGGGARWMMTQRALTGRNDPDEIEESTEDVAPADFTRIGRKTLLVVRIVTNTEEPDVNADEMEAALFGTIPHPHASAVSLEHAEENNNATSQQALDFPLEYVSVTEQYRAASLGNLIYEPLIGPGYEKGILEVNLGQHLGEDFVMDGQGIQGLAPSLLEATAKTLGVSVLTDAVDHVIYCLVSADDAICVFDF